MKITILLIIIILMSSSLVIGQEAFTTEASYYTVTSCVREGTSGICANGERLRDEGYTCASWDYSIGDVLLITRVYPSGRIGKSVKVRVNDKGPAKRLYRAGRRIDLSKAAFLLLAKQEEGVIRVRVERISSM